MSFKGQVVIVTGASSGIGAAAAVRFAAEGARVVLIGRKEAKLKAVEQECLAKGGETLAIVADVSIDDDVRRIIQQTLEKFSEINVLVNNAGVSGSGSITTDNIMEEFDKVMSINLRGAVHLSHLAVPHLIKSKGNIVNVSSVAAMAIVIPDSFIYNTSKAGLDHFTRSIAFELASKGVRVNSVNPGPVKTDIIENYMLDKLNKISQEWIDMAWVKAKDNPLKRVSDSDEIADLILFLASDRARGITGSCVVSDNGMLLQGSS